MLGAIAGDIIGSIYEAHRLRKKDFPLFDPRSQFTDDTVLTVAVADVLLSQGDYTTAFKQYCRRYPKAGYGGRFIDWGFSEDLEPYHSWGNGSAMRVSPVAYAFEDLESVLKAAKESAEVTHNHPEGIKGAQAIASAIFLARQGSSKQAIKAYIESNFAYDLNQTCQTIPPSKVSCMESVPHALVAFLDSTDFEDTIRNAVYIGGDTDTIACMAGGIAEAFYGGVPEAISTEVWKRLDHELIGVITAFFSKYAQN